MVGSSYRANHLTFLERAPPSSAKKFDAVRQRSRLKMEWRETGAVLSLNSLSSPLPDLFPDAKLPDEEFSKASGFTGFGEVFVKVCP